MNYEFCLNKDDQRSYNLFKYLEQRPTLSEQVLKIQEDLGLSKFLLNKATEKLKVDISYLNIEDSLKINSTEFEIELEIDGNYSNKILLSHYLSESLCLKLIIAFFKNEFKSVEDFAEKNFVSYSVAYNAFQVIKKELKQYQIHFKKRKITGNQQNIFSFLCSLFSITNLNKSEIYKMKTVKQAELLVDNLKENFQLTSYEKEKFFHYLAIYLEHYDSGNGWGEQKVNHFLMLSYFAPIKEIFPNVSDNLVYTIVVWLFINDKLEQDFVGGNFGTTVEQVNHDFIQLFEKRFSVLNQNLKIQLQTKLTKLHFNIFHQSLNMFDDVELNVTFFQQNYPEFYKFSFQYVQSLTKQFPELSLFRVYLFFNYLMILINVIPIDLITEPVKILVDFSYGDNYNRFIKKNLSFYINLNVVTVDSTTKPDVVITNVNKLYEKDQMEVVVWLDPPRSVDWVNLTNILLDIQAEKFE